MVTLGTREALPSHWLVLSLVAGLMRQLGILLSLRVLETPPGVMGESWGSDLLSRGLPDEYPGGNSSPAHLSFSF